MTDDILRYLRARNEYVASDLHSSLKRAHLRKSTNALRAKEHMPWS